MQLRHHPRLSRYGIHSWPPAWIKIDGSGPGTFDDESAVLESATLSRLDPPTGCHLMVKSGATTYMGTMTCDDPDFCRQVCKLMQSFIGKTVKEVGDADLP